MKDLLKILWLLSFTVFLGSCNFNRTGKSLNQENYKIMVVDDFEDPSDLHNWTGTLTLSEEFPSHGKACIRLSASEGQALWLETKEMPENWSDFDLLKFDIYNPSVHLNYGTLQICDKNGTDEQAEFQGQSYKGEDKLFLNTGWNHFEFRIHKAMVEEGDRPLAIDKIRKLRFSFEPTGKPVYIDNIRLVRGEENETTLSHTNPRDCRVIIDDRKVYPALEGSVEMIRTNGDILRLRKQALEATGELKREIGYAELQGYQMLYQRIPLITADIGMGIRSKLVWFQNEPEEKKILNYIIASCQKATSEITGMISARERDVLTMEPENDVARASFFVPPYPAMHDLKPVDGFYRDKSGQPVIILSMLQVNEGPLTDYFAPFNHRIESYTVGGGSRYNIEESPVYEAFHKYPGTHRVGWDGWCGHLIKDRWSMGGRKEDVVICLESEPIRKAIIAYIQLHYHEWINNPNLLYNIMAYELQYICYCDKSQQMFRDWLKKKYSGIKALNMIWKTDYPSFDMIRAPETHNARPVDDINRSAWFDWATFNTYRFTEYLKWIKSEMRKFDANTPICAGGTSSMLSSSNSVTGIDEEQIINEVDDVILNESGGSVIFSDLLLSLSADKKTMVDPEMGGDTHGLLLQFLHGKSDISKWWWAGYPSLESPHMNETSLPHSKEISLSDIDEVLRISLDIRRLSKEIAEFTKPGPEIAILYSKTSILQVPPGQVQSGVTPYINALYSVWEGSRFLGCRIGFISENQIIKGRLAGIKLLLVPAVKYISPDIASLIKDYVQNGGTAVMIPESFVFDQYGREINMMSDLGITINGVTLPPVIGQAEKTQNYDQSFSQAILYGEVRKKITCEKEGLFSGTSTNPILMSDGLVQNIDPGNNKVLARFDDGKAAIVQVVKGKGSIYYLAAPLRTTDYHLFLSPLAVATGVSRPLTGIRPDGSLVTGAEVRSVPFGKGYLVYACNLTSGEVEFDLHGNVESGEVLDLRSLKTLANGHVKLGPYQETIYQVTQKPATGK